MARYAEWERIPMAEGGKDPVWPLPTVTPKFATWSLGGGRPSACAQDKCCLLYTSPSPRDRTRSRMPSSA